MASIMNALGDEFRHQIVALNGQFDACSALNANVQAEVEPPPRGLLVRAQAFRKMVETRRPDLVLTYNWGAIDAAIGARSAGLCAVIHNECGFGRDESSKLKRRRIWVRRLLLKKLFRTVVTSRTMLQIAHSQYRLPLEKLQLIPTGVDIRKYKPERNAEGRRTIGCGEDTILFGYVGGLRPEKNLSLLLHALREARIAGSKLMIVGDGVCRRELENLARELGIGESVLLVGHVADPAPYLHMFDIFVMSSATEQVSNAMLEAMACGLPILCTDVGDSRDLLGPEGESCVLPAGDIAGMASRMREMARNTERRLTWGAANRRRCVACYSREAMVNGYSALFHSALTGAPMVQPMR